MSDDPAMVAIVKTAQDAGATSCRALFSAGGRIRVWTPLWGIERARLEEKLRWVLPEWYEPIAIEETCKAMRSGASA